MKSKSNTVQNTFRFLLTLLGMGIIVSCMPDDGQYREHSLLTQSTLDEISRMLPAIPVFSAQAMNISTRNSTPRRQVYVVREVDFQQHAVIHIKLTHSGLQQGSRCEVILVDARGRQYQLPGMGWDRNSRYGVSWINDGLLALELLSGPGEHYPELLLWVIDS
ncbi:MAG: hypothetical protein JJU34_11900 [Lunatimonas sp.]|uniref:hypothetical protein n=1 Tax=Lunatimonas sp. TaxID=2060141 RepID=UPI00263B6FBA|nr:hypothetical protein [Lunatimonas sp.]MCC5937974.1 hypothetical protein [Lunatimonas sp.]